MVRILSIDGGGIRGVMAAYWLMQLEKRLKTDLNATLHEQFDLFAGTSTGAIIAAGLASGNFDAQQLSELYHRHGAEIFEPHRFLKFLPAPLRSLGLRPTYDGSGLDRALGDELSNNLGEIAENNKRLLIVAFDVYKRGPIVFDSDKAEHAGYSLYELCRASAAAPSYFPAYMLDVADVDTPLLDGGLAANNPSTVALARALASPGRPDVLLVSIGTGAVQRPMNAGKLTRQVKKRGWLTWAKPVISLLMDGSSATNDEVARVILPKNYFRFQTGLPNALGAMDNATQDNLDSLEAQAKRYWQEGDTERKVADLIKTLREDAFAGIWRSNFMWSRPVSPKSAVTGVQFTESSSEEVFVHQLGDMISGETVDETNPPYRYTFRGRVERGHDVIGEWRSKNTDLSGTFQLRLDMETLKVCRGFWSGTGTDGLYVGTWTLRRPESGRVE